MNFSKLLSLVAEEITPKDVTTMCAWCKKIMKQGPEGAPISHGICNECLEREFPIEDEED